MPKALQPDQINTVGDTQFGTSLKDCEDGCLDRGYFDAAPEGNYEGYPHVHAGFIDSEVFRENHFFDDWSPRTEAGYVRRVLHKGDVERN